LEIQSGFLFYVPSEGVEGVVLSLPEVVEEVFPPPGVEEEASELEEEGVLLLSPPVGNELLSLELVLSPPELSG